MSDNVGVERIFPIESPFIDSITVNKVGKVRRAKLYYLRDLTGKKARIKEKESLRFSDGHLYKAPPCQRRGFVFIASKRDKDERFMAENGGTQILPS